MWEAESNFFFKKGLIMQIPVQISFRNIPQSDFIENKIYNKVEKLNKYSDKIMFCRVMVAAPHRHGKKGILYQIHIDITLPGKRIVAARDPNHFSHENVYNAISDAFEAVRRQLKKSVTRKRERHKKKQPSDTMTANLSSI